MTRLEFASRCLNVITGGPWRGMFSARAYRNGWRIARVIDAIFYAIRGEVGHCRRACAWEEMSRDKTGE